MQSASLPWIQHPVEVDASLKLPLESVRHLHQDLKDALTADGLCELLAPQCAMWEMCYGGKSSSHDICLNFPTGSGKTLAYALPILQNLIQASPQRVHCLRALIVLPTKTLLNQVLKVLKFYCKNLDLRIGTVGKSEIAEEMEMLQERDSCQSDLRLDGMVDVLLCTPGRLATHLDHTHGFSLRTLRFLVLDEADHLMKKRHRGCLPLLIDRIKKDTQSRSIGGSRLQTIVVSATVSRDIHALSLLDLHQPRMLCPGGSSDKRYQFPEGLKHTSIVVPAPLRPLVLVGLLNRARDAKTLIFCSTREMSKTLTDLLRQVRFLDGRVIECCAERSVEDMRRAVNRFRKRESCVLVASDVMARGMDVEDIQRVISYDAPAHVKTYLHRAGRTARAGRCGMACCLLRKQLDEKSFVALSKKLKIKVEPLVLDVEELRALKPEVDAILNGMKDKREQTVNA